MGWRRNRCAGCGVWGRRVALRRARCLRQGCPRRTGSWVYSDTYSDTDTDTDTDGLPPPECTLDVDCDPGAWCNTEGEEPACAPLAIPQACDTEPVALTFTGGPQPETELLAFDLVGPPGEELLVVATDAAKFLAFSLTSGTTTTVSLPADTNRVSGGDVDGDGDADLIVGRTFDVDMYEQTEPGVFEARDTIEFGGSSWIGLAATAGPEADVLSVRDGRVFRAVATGPWSYDAPQPITPVGGGIAREVVVGSFDGVGAEDVAWSGIPSKVSRSLNFRTDGRKMRASYEARPEATMRAGEPRRSERWRWPIQNRAAILPGDGALQPRARRRADPADPLVACGS